MSHQSPAPPLDDATPEAPLTRRTALWLTSRLAMVAGLVGCYRGLTVQGGPKGVGNAVNETVVYAFICLFVINVIMTAIGVRVLAR